MLLTKLPLLTDQSETFINVLREENERSRAHEREMAEMQMRMLQTVMRTSSYQHPYQHPINQQHIADNKNDPRSFSSSNDRGGHGIHNPNHIKASDHIYLADAK